MSALVALVLRSCLEASSGFGQREGDVGTLVDAEAACGPSNSAVLKQLSLVSLVGAEKCSEIRYKPLAKDNCTALGLVLDDFMTPRPWWSITSECFAFEGHKTELSLHKMDNSDALKHLRWIAASQYPKPEQCINHDLALYSSGSFWASLMMQILGSAFGGEVDQDYSCGGYIANGIIFATQMKFEELNMVYCDMNDGWDCFFLPMTTCDRSAGLAKWKGHHDAFMVLSKGKREIIPTQSVVEGFKEQTCANPYPESSKSLNIASYEMKYWKNKVDKTDPYERHQRSAIHRRYIFRFNARMREDMAREEQKFLKETAWKAQSDSSTGTSCVGVHIRRGDKIWPPPKCEGEDQEIRCEQDFSMTFATYMTEAMKLMPAADGGRSRRCVFVMTDDEKYARGEADKFDSKSNQIDIFMLPGEDPGEIFRQTREGAQVQISSERNQKQAALFFLSLQIMEQCYAFVGNFDSAVGELAYQWLCYNKKGTCRGVSLGNTNVDDEE